MLERFSKGLRNAINKLTGYAFVDRKEIEEVIREIQRALLSADVEVRTVFRLSEELRREMLKDPPRGMGRKEYGVKLIYEKLVSLLGGEKAEIPLRKKRVMLLGLFGSGKTTTAAKLANYYRKKGLSPFLITIDIHRPAAYDQLEQLARENGIPFFGIKGGKDIVEILERGIEKAKKADVVIIDTAGRSGLDEELVEEIKLAAEIAKPDEKMLVIPADIGQIAGRQARAFHEAVGIDGVIVTKMDATGKAGGAISACSATGARVWFIGTGEKISELEEYSPDRFVSRLLGFGDLQGLLEKAREAIDESKAEKIVKGDFTLEDFISQLESVSSMGPITRILDMLGLSSARIPKEELERQQRRMEKWKHIIKSMTREEREKPEIINQSRTRRIARGSGTGEDEVRELVKSYLQTRKMMKKLKPGRGTINIPGMGRIRLG